MERLTTFAHSTYNTANLHLFNDITDINQELISKIIGDCDIVLARADDPVITAQSSDARLYIVLYGALAVIPNEHTSNSMGNIQFLPGECVGELSVLDEEAHQYTINAVVDTQLLVIEANVLWRLIDESNGVARNLLRLLSFRIRATNAQLRRKQKVGEFYRQLSMIDGLTGLNNRAWLNSQLPNLMLNSQSTGKPLSLIMADLDHFKHFNDTHGHVLGDDAIQTAAKVLNSALRPTDFAVRYGGEELMVILPDTTLSSCYMVAERLCNKLRKSTVFVNSTIPLPHITASFGVATLTHEHDFHSFITHVDEALYRAKNAGRNQVSY